MYKRKVFVFLFIAFMRLWLMQTQPLNFQKYIVQIIFYFLLNLIKNFGSTTHKTFTNFYLKVYKIYIERMFAYV